MGKVFDNFNRPIISLRMSITNRCNINCFYCHHDGMLSTSNEMSVDEIFKIASVSKDLGVERIRFSGGEPLVRNDIVDIVNSVNSLGFRDISITTNGIFLSELCDDLIDAGLNRDLQHPSAGDRPAVFYGRAALPRVSGGGKRRGRLQADGGIPARAGFQREI